ncbi:transposase [Mesorhizobium sp. LCM 4577]|uniref:transposase n=1 Tax=Mesorhizobium sp. LCM 4577 TaxID=1848288 RepID=UPI000A64C822
MRRGGRIVSVAVIIAVGVATDRQVLGMRSAPVAKPTWTELLRKLTSRGFQDVKLVVLDVPGSVCRRSRRCSSYLVALAGGGYIS